jgi:AcrR family transcriptional regulator
MTAATAPPPARPRRGRGRAASPATPQRIIAATLAALAENGYAGTTARVIASRGGFPVGLIFYHFGTVDDLLLAVLDHTSAARLPRWAAALADVEDVAVLMERIGELYAEDIASGHATAVKELVANGAFSERLGPAITARMHPWFEMAEHVAGRVFEGSPLLTSLAPRDLAVTAVALYLGLDTVSRLSGENVTVETLFTAARRLSPLLGSMGRSRTRLRGDQPTRVPVE